MGKLSNIRVGLIGAGELGAAMARAMIENGGLPAGSLQVYTRSGRAHRLADFTGIRFAGSAREAAAGADISLLAVPPSEAAGLDLGAPGGAVMSVMAGITIDRLKRIAGHPRVIRAMSNPAAAYRVAYSVYMPSPQCIAGEVALAAALLEACGTADRVPEEFQIDLFTALTGPVPGFVAAYAAMLANWAIDRGVEAATADRAVRQLMLSSGLALAHTAPTAWERVQEMIDYAGTTAAGLETLLASSAQAAVYEALDAAAEKARTIAP